jgi:hypothetical protein
MLGGDAGLRVESSEHVPAGRPLQPFRPEPHPWSPWPELRPNALSSRRNSASGGWKVPSVVVNSRRPRGVSASDAMRMAAPPTIGSQRQASYQ